MGRLSTLDKPWLHHIGGNCILCQDGLTETHDHLFFSCSFSRRCFAIIRQQIPLPWPHRDWQHGVQWASSRWRGKHVVNAFRSLLASIVYHIWQERNARRFQQHMSRSPCLRRLDRDHEYPESDETYPERLTKAGKFAVNISICST
ncbi:UNVERIFIED_CONTAM: hypothetical protein Sangu_3170000 [Sesamum angustifolium]|uniref:Reverse transcriptase zinc-binding domain-containing protein n=1 Tax=Sesamum angustifolium TaxID=2727405 RepID=A0AAW2JTV7_9LAMI